MPSKRLALDLQVSRIAGRAVEDLSFALEQDVELIPQLLVLRYDHLARQGDHAALTETAEKMALLYPEDQGTIYEAACGYGRAVKSIDAGRAPEQLAPLEQGQRARYAGRALELLRRAVRLGYDDLAHIASDRDLEAIRSDQSFDQLAAEIGKPVDETPSPGPNALRYRFREGETLKYTGEMGVSIRGVRHGKTTSSETLITTDAVWRIKSVATDGSAQIRIRLVRLRTKTSGLGTTVLDYDSRDSEPVSKDAVSSFLNVLRRLTELEFDATIDTRGRVLEMRIPEGVKALRALAPPNMEHELSDEGLAGSLDSILYRRCPKQPRSRGQPGRGCPSSSGRRPAL